MRRVGLASGGWFCDQRRIHARRPVVLVRVVLLRHVLVAVRVAECRLRLAQVLPVLLRHPNLAWCHFLVVYCGASADIAEFFSADKTLYSFVSIMQFKFSATCVNMVILLALPKPE
jgi:hypothetical protein